ncbi:ubiquinol-cytochrome c reductase complex assembly factor 2 [Euwallacea fornicatus]|uniref:ubiquinol-cytochrome c reductase complex assembly factor 2 n=1 Tax=Euwallacea fornicatus TaxID=995702 RepID=UPI0033904F79
MAYAAASYKRILKILEKWPIDQNKAGGRDYCEFLTKYVTQAYKENTFETNCKYWDQQYLALQKLVNNTNKEKYKRVLSSSATTLTAEQCNQVLSNEFLEELKQEEKKSFFRRLVSIRPSK